MTEWKREVMKLWDILVPNLLNFFHYGIYFVIVYQTFCYSSYCYCGGCFFYKNI